MAVSRSVALGLSSIDPPVLAFVSGEIGKFTSHLLISLSDLFST
jgi:hypothetical protein